MNTVIKLEVKVNYGPDLVNRPQGERYNPQYMSTCKCSGPVSVHCWGCISHEEDFFFKLFILHAPLL